MFYATKKEGGEEENTNYIWMHPQCHYCTGNYAKIVHFFLNIKKMIGSLLSHSLIAHFNITYL